MSAGRRTTGNDNSCNGRVRARKAAPTRSKLDAAFHRVPPCSVSYWSKIYRVAAAEASPRPFLQKKRRVKQVSSGGGKPGVKPAPPRALRGAEVKSSILQQI